MKSAEACAQKTDSLLTTAAAPLRCAAPVQIDSSTLFGRGQEVLIQHQDQTYRLRITSQGKLILTK